MLKFILLSIFFALPAAAGEVESVPWGTPVQGGYRVWDWLETTGYSDESYWEGLEPEKQKELASMAYGACRRAGAALSSTENMTNGRAILALSQEQLRDMAVCLPGGELASRRLGDINMRLKELVAKSARGELKISDSAWFEANGVRLSGLDLWGKTNAEETAARKASSEKLQKAAAQKYGKLGGGKDLSAEKLGGLYDGAGGKGTDAALSGAAVGLGAAKLGAPPAPAERKTSATTIGAEAPGKLEGTGPASDVDRLKNIFDGSVRKMVAEGKREPGTGTFNGIVNNMKSVFGGGSKLRCYDQAEELLTDLGKSYGVQNFGTDFKDPSGRWEFKKSTYAGEGHEADGHYWVTAVSKDPRDPTLIMDPWTGEVKQVKEKNPVAIKGFLPYLMGFYMDKLK